MPFTRSGTFHRCVCAACATLLLSPATGSLIARPQIAADELVVPIRPARRAPDAPPVPPPDLPPASELVSPLTLEVVVERRIHGRPAAVVHQTISRTADRIHVATGSGREWLFERNIRDSRRVSAFFIDHEARTIVMYEESDLRNRSGISGWADVLTLGADSRLVARMKPTGEARTINGIRFVRHAAGDGRTPLSNVWWSEKHAFPSAFTSSDAAGSVRFSVARLRDGVDRELLEPPALRFPKYSAIDLADWMERG